MSPHPYRKCALIIAHPGHELRVHGWLEIARPTVYVLTDGSGRASRSRLASTTRLLERVGARPGSIYGQYSDRELYDAVLRRDAQFFCGLASQLAAEIVCEQFDFVLGDAREGHILAHDVWRGVIDAALSAVQAHCHQPIASFAFSLEDPTPDPAQEPMSAAILHRLDDAALARKLAAMRAYSELRSEAEAFLAKYGMEGLRLEYLLPSQNLSAQQPSVPHYEQHGEALVAQGVYPAVVRFREHVLPILTALQSMHRAA